MPNKASINNEKTVLNNKNSNSAQQFVKIFCIISAKDRNYKSKALVAYVYIKFVFFIFTSKTCSEIILFIHGTLCTQCSVNHFYCQQINFLNASSYTLYYLLLFDIN